jgi:uncharacterized protein (UPF0335 family)
MTKKKPTAAKGKNSAGSKPRARPGPRAARPGDNTLEGRATPYLKRIENKLDDLDSKRGAYMAACKVVREDIKEIYGEAKDHGVPVKALKGLVEYRTLERKQAKIGDGLDIDEGAAYEQLVDALGPLGIAAARAAGYRASGGDEEDDPRPRHMRQPDALSDAAETPPAEQQPAQRPDEAELARLGRGDEPTAEQRPAQGQ